MPAKNTPVDAVALLKADHRTVEDLFDKFEKATKPDRKKAIADQVCLELRIHAQIEEDVFYPACIEAGVDDDLMDEAYVEHDSAKVLIAEIEKSSPDAEYYDAKVKVLSEMIKHHVKEEEKKQGNMFAEAKKKGVDGKALGESMANEKKFLLEKMSDGSRPTPKTPTMEHTKLGV